MPRCYDASLLLVCLLVACEGPKREAAVVVASRDTARSTAEPQLSQHATKTEPRPVAVVPAPSPIPGKPRKVVNAKGIEITETSDGRVLLKATTTWGEAIDTVYTDCSYFTAAIPVLRGQLPAAQAKLLPRACVQPSAASQPGR